MLRETDRDPSQRSRPQPARSSASGAIRIGTSGWHYGSWRGVFFPDDVRVKDHLRYYAEHFSTCELNGVFYRTPALEAVRAWRKDTPDDFVFAWKASKFITHWKRLGPTCPNSIALMETRLCALGRKAGPVLFQLPPQMTADRERLLSFFKMLKKKRQYAFEFRHPSWYEEPILAVLRDHDAALCLSDHHDAPAPWEVTARHVYVRGHGPGGRYRGRYPLATLQRWAAHIRDWAGQGRAVYCYFDNDQKSAAPCDARRLMELLRPAASPLIPAAAGAYAGWPQANACSTFTPCAPPRCSIRRSPPGSTAASRRPPRRRRRHGRQ